MPYNTKFSVVLYIALAVGSHHRVLAANDWSTPCKGQCSYDLPSHSNASGSLHISGPSTAVSDITQAAGWNITHCDPSATAQEIQLVCHDGNNDCNHLFEGGAVDTIVRLSENCGKMPFARVASHRTAQSNSSGSPAMTVRASDAPVHYLTIDTNFAAVTPPSNGSVSFTVQAVNVKGSNALTTSTAVHHRRQFDGRWLKGSPRHIHQRGNIFEDALKKLQHATAFNKTLSKSVEPVNFSGAKNLFNTSINCPAESSAISSTASLSLDVDAEVYASISLGVVAAGTLVPPKISEFGLALGMNGNIDTLFGITANLTGHISSGSISLVEIGIAGVSFPGILELGPKFKLTGNIEADLALDNVNASVRVAYNLSEVSVTFPPQQSSTGGSFSQGVSEVSVSAGPNTTDAGASVNVTAHLIPQLSIGVSALGGLVDTSVFLNLDASADLNLSTNAGGNDSGSAQACADANTGLAVTIGAEASFFNLFNASTGAELFNKNFPLSQKCVGMSNSTSVSSKSVTRRSSSTTSQGLACP